ncbi:tRNA 2-selenouridine(34) synthase MnmH [Salinicola rhizosphaerae]|uniref:tRNA 2-selenouridine synthase n=1 Tax=Salinicola rhizosphaerae TaxID=1443141 RepID=A0ABQ3EIC0_9GAMM|nr:tRNA 2-selenouridine(34) synthase MnmH [Salinicola rhizosphaerae]GHB33236.1 tRNA 2-selenouridine synthase [Salinicola rhizosphaerae]
MSEWIEAELSLLGRPLIDVRAPIEFAAGALPGAVNLPLMDDAERREVGIRYKQAGQASAVDLGNELVSGERREARLAAWERAISDHPESVLYCFRGGMRSKISQQWLAARGHPLPRIRGGWKAMRNRLIEALEAHSAAPLLLIAGLTGCAKTALVNELASGVDLEGHARHKGSAFGQHPLVGPSQIDFEHGLALDLMRLPRARVVEDESQRIGRLAIPATFWQAMKAAPCIRVEMPLEWRLEQIRKDYIDDLRALYRRDYGDHLGELLFRKQLSGALRRLGKRLGSERLGRLVAAQQRAFDAHRDGVGSVAHEAWLAPLLQEYYDPMYRHQIDNQPRPTLHVGDWESCLEVARQWERDHAG